MYKRIEYLDIAKGIAIISIILGHLEVKIINKVVFTFHVPIFFIITGYFINNKYTIKEFTKKKFKRLIIPYFITSIVMILFSIFKHSPKTWFIAAIYGAGDNHVFLGHNIKAIGATWFLLATFSGSIMLRISLNFKKNVRVIFIAFLFIIGYYSSKLIWLPISIQAGFCSTFFIYLGYLWNTYYNKYEKYYLKYKKVLIMFSVIMWIQFIYNFKSFWLVHCDIGRGIIDIIGCICACYVVILISKLIKEKTKWICDILKKIGKCSMLILCIHIIELSFIPWFKIITINHKIILKTPCEIMLIAVAKIIFDIGLAYILSNKKIIKKVF